MGRAESPLRDRVIFVEGAPRSGTTWLVALLATHPEIAGVGAESHLFDFGLDRLFDNFEKRDPLLHGLNLYLRRDELVDLARDLCDGVLMAMRSHVSGPTTPEFVVEKTPAGAREDGLDLERKRDCYPDAWYIHVVRDREAVTRSLMRAPFISDRSPEGCGALWDRVVGAIRHHLSDLPRYLEVSYEELRADPGEGCRQLFEWVGVGAGEEVLETVRVLSRERFSDVGAVPPAQSGRSGSRARRALARGRMRVGRAQARLAPRHDGASRESTVTFLFMRALRECDVETMRSLTHPSLELVLRRPDGDLSVDGDEARDALARLAEDGFGRSYVSDWWASAGGGPGEWWTTAPNKPFCTGFFSGLAGDATRVDVAVGLVLEDGLVRRAVVISAGPLTGRPVAAAANL
jgi:hypothetical protein